MLSQRTRTWSRRRVSRRLVAMEVAIAYCDAAAITDPDAIDDVVGVTIAVGENLAAQGHPGDWARIDIDGLLEPLDHEAPAATAVLTAMLPWLADVGAVPRRIVRGYLRQLARRHADPPPQAPARHADSA